MNREKLKEICGEVFAAYPQYDSLLLIALTKLFYQQYVVEEEMTPETDTMDTLYLVLFRFSEDLVEPMSQEEQATFNAKTLVENVYAKLEEEEYAIPIDSPSLKGKSEKVLFKEMLLQGFDCDKRLGFWFRVF